MDYGKNHNTLTRITRLCVSRTIKPITYCCSSYTGAPDTQGPNLDSDNHLTQLNATSEVIKEVPVGFIVNDKQLYTAKKGILRKKNCSYVLLKKRNNLIVRKSIYYLIYFFLF